MKANELMIFDLVRRKKDNRTMIVVEVGYDENIGAITTDDRFYGDFEDYHETQVEPIPITPEILEKNGFKVMHGISYSETYPTYGWGYYKTFKDNASVDVTFYDEPIAGVSTLVRMGTNSSAGDGTNNIHSCDCNYIHQLQHALRLCGIKKEIKL